MQNIKTLKIEGDWDRLWAKVFAKPGQNISQKLKKPSKI